MDTQLRGGRGRPGKGPPWAAIIVMFKRGKGNERERHKSVLRCALLDLTEPPDVNQTSFFDRPPSAREIDSLKVNLIAEIVRADNSLMDKVIRFLKAEVSCPCVCTAMQN